MKIIIGIVIVFIFFILIINFKWFYSFYKFLNPFLITVISSYLTVRLPLPFNKIFPTTYHSQLNLGAYALVLSAIKIGIDKIYELNQSKISLLFSSEEDVFHEDEQTVYVNFNNDVSKVFVRMVFDGPINHLAKANTIKLRLPIQVTAQKMKKYAHLYDLEDSNKTVVIHIEQVLSMHKEKASSDEIVLGFDVIKSSDTVNSPIDPTIHHDFTFKKPEFKFNKVKFTK